MDSSPKDKPASKMQPVTDKTSGSNATPSKDKPKDSSGKTQEKDIPKKSSGK